MSGLNYSQKIEARVIRHLLKAEFEVLGWSVRTAMAEVDVFALKNGCYHIVEVKSGGLDLCFAPRVSKDQCARLQRVAEVFIEKFNRPIRVHLAIVSRSGSIEYFSDFLTD